VAPNAVAIAHGGLHADHAGRGAPAHQTREREPGRAWLGRTCGRSSCPRLGRALCCCSDAGLPSESSHNAYSSLLTSKNDDTGNVANDYCHRYKENDALMRSLGATAYRFSISSPRMFPESSRQPNVKAIDFYNRLVDEVLAVGIAPWGSIRSPRSTTRTCPQALQGKGRWQSRDIPQAFAGYVAE
jgi:hypothetical protein